MEDKIQAFRQPMAYSGQGVNLSFLFGDVIAALHQGNDHPWLATPYANNTLPFIPPEPFRTPTTACPSSRPSPSAGSACRRR